MKQLKWITTTAVLLALIVVAQLIPFPAVIFPTLITGSLVNLILITASGAAGIGCAATLAVVSPVLASLLGKAPVFMVPVIIIGNVIIVVVTWLLFRLAEDFRSVGAVFFQTVGIILGAVLKCAFLWVMTDKVVIPLLLPAMHLPAKKIAALTTTLNVSFSWPQGVTALIGGVLALLILPALGRFLKNNRSYLIRA